MDARETALTRADCLAEALLLLFLRLACSLGYLFGVEPVAYSEIVLSRIFFICETGYTVCFAKTGREVCR